MSTIEAVARVLALNAGGKITGPGQCVATREFAWAGDGGHFQKYVEHHWKEYTGAAQMAIDVMTKNLENHVEGTEQAKSVLVPQPLLEMLLDACRAGMRYEDGLDASTNGDDSVDLVALYADWIGKSRAAWRAYIEMRIEAL